MPKVLVLCSLVLLAGCQEGALSADRVSASLTARQIRGRHNGFKTEAWMPLWQVKALRRQSSRLDWYSALEWNGGTMDSQHRLLHGGATGSFIGAGGGLNYYPLKTRSLGLTAGLEAFLARYKMRARLGPFRDQESDRFWGAGGKLGLVGEWPLGQHGRLSWSAGRNQNAVKTGKADASLNGWFSGIGIEVDLGN